MSPFQINVSSDACKVLQTIARQIEEQLQQLQQEIVRIQLTYTANQSGLGPHASEIAASIDMLNKQEKQLHQLSVKLVRHIRMAANNRRDLMEQNYYQESETSADHMYIPEVLGRMYDELYRMRIRPGTLVPQGQTKGRWEGNVFFLDEAFVPRKHNPEHKTFGTLCQDLQERFGIVFRGVSFENGYADFGYLAVAKVAQTDILAEHIREHPELTNADLISGKLFFNRTVNMGYADAVAAKRQLSISNLKSGYSKEELAQWRKENGFTWDENYKYGYCLVPSFIHNNILHTGLVALENNISRAEEKLIHKGE